MRFFIIVILFLSTLNSCSNNSKVVKTSTLAIPIDTVQCIDVEFSDIIKEYDWVVLDDDDKCFINNPSKTLFFGDKIYVVDKERNNAVLVFDEKGKFINKIGKNGNGHGEYANIMDVTINEDAKQVAILSFPNLVYIYDLDGNFVSKHIFPEDMYYSMVYYRNGYILSNSNATYIEGEKAKVFTYYDDSFTEIERFFDTNKVQLAIPFTGSSSFVNTNGSLFYLDLAANRILNWKNDIHDLSVLELQYDRPMPLENYGDLMEFNTNITNYNLLMDSFISDSVMFCQYVTEGKIHNLMGDMSKGFYKRVNNMLFMTYYNRSNGYFYSPLSAEMYEEMQDALPAMGMRGQDQIGNLMFLKWKV